MKKAISLRIDEDILALVDRVSTNSGWNRTAIIELSIQMLRDLCVDSEIPLEQLKSKHMHRILVNSYITASI